MQSLLDLALAPLLALSVGVLLGAWLQDPLEYPLVYSRELLPEEALELLLEALPEEQLRAKIPQVICYRQAVSLPRKEAKNYLSK